MAAEATKPFVILFQERSGSTYLVSVLRSHSEILCRYEDFDTVGPDHSIRLLHPLSGDVIQNPRNDQTRQHLNAIFHQPGRAAGFKFKYPFQYNRFPEVLMSLLKIRHRLRVLFLDRKDVVRRVISQQHLLELRKSHTLVSANVVEHCPAKRFRVDTKAIRDMAIMEAHRRTELQTIASQFPNNLTIEYEDLRNLPESTIREITDFLGVTPFENIESRFFKATPNDLAKVVENLDELREALHGLPLNFQKAA